MPHQDKGALILVATPIGNLGDLSPRAAALLREADVILVEDTRRAHVLLGSQGIRKRPVRFDEYAERRRVHEFVDRIRQGETVALVSDAGTPAISDPGFRLVRACREAGLPVTTAPGPCAAIAALSISGLPTDRFFFAGYPPRSPSARRRFFRELAGVPGTLVFYETPHRLARSLEDAGEALGNRQAVLARELTKLHEEVRHGFLHDLRDHAAAGACRGEYVVLVGGQPRPTRGTATPDAGPDPGDTDPPAGPASDPAAAQLRRPVQPPPR